MPLQILRNDITKMQVDAIVNAAKNSLLGGGGVDGCIHRAAGPELLAQCRTLGGCDTGDAKITKGYDLPCKYVIHTVGPIWFNGQRGEAELLKSCYRKALQLAAKYECESVAFPLISCGAYGFPRAKGLRIAVEEITDFLQDHEMTIYIVVFDSDSFQISWELYDDIESFIDDHYVETHSSPRQNRFRELRNVPMEYATAPCAPTAAPPKKKEIQVPQISLDDFLDTIDESFSQMLLRIIDERGLKDSHVYKKANIDRKLFSKIRSDPHYKPSKPTVLALAIALELSLRDTNDMLMKAGFALSHSNKFDLIVEYFIRHGNYNIFEINEALFAFDQSLLGM